MNNYCTRALLYNTNQTTVQIVHKYVKLVFDTRLPPSFNDISDGRQIKRIAIGNKPITEKPTDDEVLKENNINIRNLGYVDTMPGSRQTRDCISWIQLFSQFPQYDHYCLEQITHPSAVRKASIHIYILNNRIF